MASVNASDTLGMTRLLSNKVDDEARMAAFRAKAGMASAKLDVFEKLLSPLVQSTPDAGLLDIRA